MFKVFRQKIKKYLSVRKDSALDDFLADLKFSFDKKALSKMIRKYAKNTVDFQERHLKELVKNTVSVDVFLDDTKLEKTVKKFIDENVDLIQSIPEDLANQLQPIIFEAASQGARQEDIEDKIAQRFSVTRTRAKVIARDQIGKMYSDVNTIRQEELGITKYIWRTANDDRVRPEHERREGKSFAWDDPPFDGRPGTAILCRCYAEPDFNSLE